MPTHQDPRRIKLENEPKAPVSFPVQLDAPAQPSKSNNTGGPPHAYGHGQYRDHCHLHVPPASASAPPLVTPLDRIHHIRSYITMCHAELDGLHASLHHLPDYKRITQPTSASFWENGVKEGVLHELFVDVLPAAAALNQRIASEARELMLGNGGRVKVWCG